jgi:hypothetical protein
VKGIAAKHCTVAQRTRETDLLMHRATPRLKKILPPAAEAEHSVPAPQTPQLSLGIRRYFLLLRVS